MTILAEERLSDSPFVESITRGVTVGAGSPIRPAERHWHMVLVKHQGNSRLLLVGPLMTAGTAVYGEGAEILWVKFKLGAFMPHLPPKQLIDGETVLPEAAGQSFWLKGSAWQLPNYENIDTFVNRLVRDEVLVADLVVRAALRGELPKMAARTVRHRFVQATGLTQNYIRQVERAQRAAVLLRQGVPILDTVYDLGYFDQPHLTRAVKQFVGYTPAQLGRM